MALPGMLSSLTAERACFEEQYPLFAQDHFGEVVLISGQKILGFFMSPAAAEEAAYRKHGLFGQPFLIRTIMSQQEEERVETFQRSVLAELA